MSGLKHWDALLAQAVVDADNPLVLDADGNLTILPAASGQRGTMSGTHFELLDGATEGDVENVAANASKVLLLDGNADAACRVMRASVGFEVGTVASGTASFQLTAPTVEGNLQVDPVTGRVAGYVGGAARGVQFEHERPPLTWTKEKADTGGTDEIAEFVWFAGMPFAITITGLWLYASDNLPSSDVAYAAFNVSARDLAGTSNVPIVATTTQATGGIELLQWRRTQLPFATGTSYALPAGYMLTFEQAKVGSVVAPAYTLVVFYTRTT